MNRWQINQLVFSLHTQYIPIHRTHHRITCHGGIYVYYICIYIVNVLYIKHYNTLKYNMYCNMLSCHIMLRHSLSDCKWSRLARPSACSRWSILNRTSPQLCRLSWYPGMFSGWAKHFPGDRVFRRCRGVRMLVPWSKIIKSTEKMTLLDCHMLEAILSTWKIYERLRQWYQRISSSSTSLKTPLLEAGLDLCNLSHC